MSSEEAVNLTAEDRLKALTYQFVKLYERWAEDRQALNQQLCHQADILKIFNEQLKKFSELTPQVQKQLIDSIKHEAHLVAEQIGAKVSETATAEINKNVQMFGDVVKNAASTLRKYEVEVKRDSISNIVIPIIASVIASLAIVWLLMPKSTMPLTDDQLTTYQDGQYLAEFWPKLTKKEQKHLIDLANMPAISKVNNEDGNDNSNEAN